MKSFATRLFNSLAGGAIYTILLWIALAVLVFARDVLVALSDLDCIGGRQADMWTCDHEPNISWLMFAISHPRWPTAGIAITLLVLSVMLFKSNFRFQVSQDAEKPARS